MSTHKHIDRICIAAVAISLVITVLFMNGSNLGIKAASRVMGYESRLFDTSRVHTIDIVMDDWDSFIESCQNEEYNDCTAVIDGESYKNIAIRAKGNTSLSSVASMNSDRYSFKIEFDHYDSNNTYHGLDKLSLNNIIQDNTYMKDYLTYRMMYESGVNAPLCSYAYITVNGEDWGLYLAVEGIEDAFLQRNYGNDSGELYKPDSMSFGGGRGNGKDFKMEDFMNSDTENSDTRFNAEEFKQQLNQLKPSDRSGGFSPNKMGGGMGSSDVKLIYTDDDSDSYSNIFDNAKTDVTDDDKERLISSLKQLGENENIEEIVDVEQVIRYFAVHNYVCNGDSYTGSIIHNYYLYEKDGQLSMIPWDYNLAFGTFQGGNASEQVNYPIDTPVSGGDTSDRPMLNWIFENEEYTQLYHKYLGEFIESVDIQGIIDSTAVLIAPYVEKDPTKFCTYDEFAEGIEVLRKFCKLRTESVKGQLDGTIPSTSEGQSADSTALVETDKINLSAMGTMNQGGGFEKHQQSSNSSDNMQTPPGMPDGFNFGEMPENFDPSKMQGGEMSENFNPDNMSVPQYTVTGNSQSESGTDTASSEPIKQETTMTNENDSNSKQNDNRKNPFETGGMPTAKSQQDSGWVMLGISAVVLAAGLVFAAKFKR